MIGQLEWLIYFIRICNAERGACVWSNVLFIPRRTDRPMRSRPYASETQVVKADFPPTWWFTFLARKAQRVGVEFESALFEIIGPHNVEARAR